MRVDAFHYTLPAELIAQHPPDDREAARMMILPRDGGPIEHRSVAELAGLVPEGALVVVNDTRVIPARLVGRKRDSGGRVEVLLVRCLGVREIEVAPGHVRDVVIWRALGKASRALRFQSDIVVHAHGDDSGSPRLVLRLLGRAGDDGLLEVAVYSPCGEPVLSALHACGHVPLPPYIKRSDAPQDVSRYQTVYARHDGAVAAPTAGFHLTHALLGRLAVHGCEVTAITLHVGLGTFQPVVADDFDLHRMHAERVVVSQSTVDAVAKARSKGAAVVAIGTTTVRALESAADEDNPGHVRSIDTDTQLLIQPGYRWRVVDALLTNFHLPRSSLLALTCAFGGTERVLEAYGCAVRERYRFYSYGDAMFLWRLPT
ncbi:MAG: tRNA preQ1(34) S-adenosylmethionine ribosyltransferase-isomerase QueA [Polyangiaceae bacterium]|jgi:S-adenosylmethionine:tRNA ribosyltransferase-isomerase